MTRRDAIPVWLLRAAWLTLPISAGDALARASDGWATPTRVVGAVLVWSAWSVGVLAVLAPRPVGLTAMRALAPAAFAVTLAAGLDVGGATGVAAVAAGVVTAVLGLGPAFALAAAGGASYGDERRYPLRVPPALFLGPLPLAVALVGAGPSAGPLLVAAGHVVAGVAALVVGLPLALVAARSLHGLSRRWAVLVPAGLVLADAAVLGDPVLFRHERVRALRPIPPGSRPDADALDLRLGVQRGGVALELDEASDMIHVRRGRRRAELTPSHVIWFAPTRRGDLFAAAGTQRLPVLD